MSGFTVIDTIRALTAQLAAFEALLLLASAVHKILTWTRAQGVVREFVGVPASLAVPALAVALVGEFAAAVLLLLDPGYRATGAMLAAVIWAVYLALILRAMLQGRSDIDCGCSFGARRRPLGSFQVTRNTVLLGFAVMVALSSPSSVSVQGSQALAACAFLALYAALDQAMALQPLRGGEVS